MRIPVWLLQKLYKSLEFIRLTAGKMMSLLYPLACLPLGDNGYSQQLPSSVLARVGGAAT